jgi:murein DD-endopeptidase MepM/ murein hydrolase activator NlpD
MPSKWLKALGAMLLLIPALTFNRNEVFSSRPASEAAARRYPTGYFGLPVRQQVRLTGTFGELRPNHFHSGIDIKSSNGVSGDPVYAAAEGYIDRVKVQAGGYGNVLYIRHPNGYTTVYAHLDRFAPNLAEYVREAQYRQQEFEVDLALRPTDFPVERGHEIGKMGNSGGSTGPHLHFEIRRTANDRALNPLLFGFPVADNVRPAVRDLKAYFLNERREVIGGKALSLFRRVNGTYGVPGDTVRLAAWRAGFGLKVYDQLDGLNNENGIAVLRVYADDQLAFQWQMDELNLDETRYLNAHIDYPVKEKWGAWFHRCFVLPGDRLSNYAPTDMQGAIPLYKDRATKITAEASDAAGNKAVVSFWALRAENITAPYFEPYQFALPYNSDSRVDLEQLSLVMPRGALYETLRFQHSVADPSPKSKGIYSAIHRVHDETAPVHSDFEMSLEPVGLPAHLRDKAVIAKIGEGRPDNCGGQWKNGRLATRVKSFGKYCIMADTEPPEIKPISFGANLAGKKAMVFRIRDNFAVNGAARHLRFRGTVDGQWVLFQYDRKSARLIHYFDERIPPGEHVLRLQVWDDRGNEAVFERPFTR